MTKRQKERLVTEGAGFAELLAACKPRRLKAIEMLVILDQTVTPFSASSAKRCTWKALSVPASGNADRDAPPVQSRNGCTRRIAQRHHCGIAELIKRIESS